MNISIELVDILGYIENDTGKLAKSFLFSIIDIEKEYTFEIVFIIHEVVEPFIVIHEDDKDYSEDELIKEILNKYKLEELFEA